MDKNYLYILLFLTQLCFSQQIANDVIAISGEQFKHSKGTINQTTGELVSSTISNKKIVLTQGFQQTYEAENSSSNTIGILNTEISIYPNPTTGYFSVKSSVDAEFNMYNVLGQAIQIVGDLKKGLPTSINISHLQDGVYLLKIKVDEDSYKSYKIIKNK